MSDLNRKQYSLPFCVFKNSSALRFRLMRPKFATEEGKRDEEGCVFMEMAPVKDASQKNKTYKWENEKISVKLGISDLQQIAYALSRGVDCEMFHSFNDVSKSISFKRTDGGKSPYFVSVSQTDANKEKKNVSIPVSAPEAHAIMLLMNSAICSILDW